jgi:hypothetical protein
MKSTEFRLHLRISAAVSRDEGINAAVHSTQRATVAHPLIQDW